MENLNEYNSKRENLKKKISLNKKDFYKSNFFGSYMLISSSLSIFLPQINRKNHFKLAQSILFQQSLSYIDQFYPELLNNFEIVDPKLLIEKSEKDATIFVTYHTGSYRMFLHFLATKKDRFCLVVQQKYFDENEDITQNLLKISSISNDGVYEIISAEDPRLLIHLRNKIKAGLSVVFYIDGNTGVALNENKEKNNLTKIDFLNHHIYARQGIAYLAYLTKAPIVSVLSQRTTENSNRLNLEEVIATKDFENRNDFIHEITEKLYQKLEDFIKNHPEQWEGWLYLNNFCDPKLADSNKIKQNIKLFDTETIIVGLNDHAELYKSDNKCFLALKDQLKIMELDEEKFLFIKHFIKKQRMFIKKPFKIKGVIYEWKFIEQMVVMNILKII